MDVSTYNRALDQRVAEVYSANPDLADHRQRHGWLTGYLGDPFAGIWFVAEKASLTQIERARDPDGGPPTQEAQWFASAGDRLFRTGLVKSGFKSGAIDEKGGWNCYITNIVKGAEFVTSRKTRSQTALRKEAERWSAVLDLELKASRPALVVLMGKMVAELMTHLARSGYIQLPRVTHIEHYSYIATRPCGRLGPMHPDRVAAYLSSFDRVREELRRAQP